MAEGDQGRCRQVQFHLAEYLDGSSGRMGEAIGRHLQECAGCRERVEFYRWFSYRLSDAPGPRLGFEHRLERIIEEAEHGADPVRQQRRFISKVSLGAALLVAFFGGILPSVQDLISSGFPLLQGYGPLFAGAGVLVLVASTPLFLTRIRQREEKP